MPVFEYKGLTRDGKSTKGIVDADNQRAARAKLKKDGIFVNQLTDKKKGSTSATKKKGYTSKSVPVKDLSLMTRQLATLLKANIPLVDTLQAVSEQVENPTLQEILSEVRNSVNEGGQFYKALSHYCLLYTSLGIYRK